MRSLLIVLLLEAHHVDAKETGYGENKEVRRGLYEEPKEAHVPKKKVVDVHVYKYDNEEPKEEYKEPEKKEEYKEPEEKKKEEEQYRDICILDISFQTPEYAKNRALQTRISTDDVLLTPAYNKSGGGFNASNQLGVWK